jgi:hypothetical protein
MPYSLAAADWSREGVHYTHGMPCRIESRVIVSKTKVNAAKPHDWLSLDLPFEQLKTDYGDTYLEE